MNAERPFRAIEPLAADPESARFCRVARPQDRCSALGNESATNMIPSKSHPGTGRRRFLRTRRVPNWSRPPFRGTHWLNGHRSFSQVDSPGFQPPTPQCGIVNLEGREVTNFAELHSALTEVQEVEDLGSG